MILVLSYQGLTSAGPHISKTKQYIKRGTIKHPAKETRQQKSRGGGKGQVEKEG